MKPNIFIHRNLYARGLGFSVVREGTIVFNFWAWHISGSFYFGKRFMVEESTHNKRLAESADKLDAALLEVDRLKNKIRISTGNIPQSFTA
jgi:hypothetical protein